MTDIPNNWQTRNRVMEELNTAGVLEWDDVEPGSPQYQERMNTATIECVRLTQTLAKEIDRLYAEVEKLRAGQGRRDG